MTDDEILDAIRQVQVTDPVAARVGRHDVYLTRIRIGGREPLTTVFRIRDGRLTLLRAANGTYREDVAAALLDATDKAPPLPGGSVHLMPLSVDGFALDRVVLFPPSDGFRRRPDLREVTVRAAAVHRSEIRPGETLKTFEEATGKVMRLPIDDWSRTPQPRADVRLLDDWPGGSMTRTDHPVLRPAEHLVTTVLPRLPRGIHIEATDVRGHHLVLTRDWDRLTGTLTMPRTTTASDPTVPATSVAPYPPAPSTPRIPGATSKARASSDADPSGYAGSISDAGSSSDADPFGHTGPFRDAGSFSDADPFGHTGPFRDAGSFSDADSFDQVSAFGGTYDLEGPESPAGSGARHGTVEPDAPARYPIDLPRVSAWPALRTIFAGDEVVPELLTVPREPEQDLLEFTYQTVDHGWASIPLPDTLENCVARIRNQIIRTPENWAVFRSRSQAIVQVRCEDHEPPLWLETPYPEADHSLGRHVTLTEAEHLLTILAREDRSAVPELDALTTVPWP
ncbi:hypothetical protein [Actinoplanes utahensis]|nr:hypothetical protein [Actinoplanes utahensis]